MEPLEFTY